MSIDWKIVRKEHIARACELLSASETTSKGKAMGLVVMSGNVEFPAKQVLRVAYCIARGWPHNTEVKFSSGDGTINTLRRLGFDAHRRSPVEDSRTE